MIDARAFGSAASGVAVLTVALLLVVSCYDSGVEAQRECFNHVLATSYLLFCCNNGYERTCGTWDVLQLNIISCSSYPAVNSRLRFWCKKCSHTH